MPSNWSKLRDEWLDSTAIAKDDAKWALEVLINGKIYLQKHIGYILQF